MRVISNTSDFYYKVVVSVCGAMYPAAPRDGALVPQAVATRKLNNISNSFDKSVPISFGRTQRNVNIDYKKQLHSPVIALPSFGS
jgi:hypothetical protein